MSRFLYSIFPGVAHKLKAKDLASVCSYFGGTLAELPVSPLLHVRDFTKPRSGVTGGAAPR